LFSFSPAGKPKEKNDLIDPSVKIPINVKEQQSEISQLGRFNQDNEKDSKIFGTRGKICRL
jgi:hypothetical protein